MRKSLLQDLQTEFDKELDSDEDIDIDADPLTTFYKMVEHLREKSATENVLLIDMPTNLGIDPNKKLNESTGKLDSVVWLYGAKVAQSSIEIQKMKCKFLRFFQPIKQDKGQSHKQKKEEKAFGKKTLDLRTLSQSFDTLSLNPFYNQTGRQLDVLDLGCLLLNKPMMNSDLTVVIDPDQLMTIQEDAVLIHDGFIKLEDDCSPFDYSQLNMPNERINFRFIYEFRDRVDVLFPKRKEIQDKAWAIVDNQINERQLPSWLQAQQSQTFQEYYQRHSIKKQEDFDQLPQLQRNQGQFIVKQQEPQDIPAELSNPQVPQFFNEQLVKMSSQHDSERRPQKLEDDLEYRSIPQFIQNTAEQYVDNAVIEQSFSQLQQVQDVDQPQNSQPQHNITNQEQFAEQIDQKEYDEYMHFEGYEQDYIDQMQENDLEQRQSQIEQAIQNPKIDEISPSNQPNQEQLEFPEQPVQNSNLNETFLQNALVQQIKEQIPQVQQPIQNNALEGNTIQNIRNQSIRDMLQNVDRQYKHEQRQEQVIPDRQVVEQTNQLKHELVNFQQEQQPRVDDRLQNKYQNFKDENQGFIQNRTSAVQSQQQQLLDDYDQIESDFSDNEFRYHNYQKIEQVQPKPKLQQKQIQRFQFNAQEQYNRRELQQLSSAPYDVQRLLRYLHLEDQSLNIQYHRFFEFFTVNVGKCDELKEEVPILTEIQQLEEEDVMEIIQIENFPAQERIESQDDQFLEFNYYALPMKVVKKNSLPINMKQMQELIITMLKKIEGPVSFLKLYQSLPYIIDEHITKQKFFAALMFVCKTNISLGQIESNDFQFKSLLGK